MFRTQIDPGNSQIKSAAPLIFFLAWHQFRSSTASGKFLLNSTRKRFRVLTSSKTHRSLSDIEIGDRLNAPIASETLEEIVSPGDSVLIVVPDATRQTASGQIINLLARRLISNGTSVADISIISRPVSTAG